MRKKTLRLVEIAWGDAWQSAGWAEDDEEPGDNVPHICYSTGWVVYDTKRGITLSGAISPEKGKVGWGHKQFVPRGMIIKVREIEKLKVDLEKN